ncbi:MAG: M24 family metallopeptidase, partial [Patescibacteria group bacterium]|nr:M24 family metallopeptidase [Patescibacteria group bacterium]
MTQKAILQIKENTKIAENTLFKIVNSIKPGISTYELNRIAKQEFKKNNALPSTKFLGLKHYLSIGINEEIFFGEISKTKKIRKGDVIQISLGLFKNGYFTDLALAKTIGRVSLEKEKLVKGSAMALYKAINLLKSNLKLYEISNLIEKTLRGYNLTPICEIMGHGL